MVYRRPEQRCVLCLSQRLDAARAVGGGASSQYSPQQSGPVPFVLTAPSVSYLLPQAGSVRARGRGQPLAPRHGIRRLHGAVPGALDSAAESDPSVDVLRGVRQRHTPRQLAGMVQFAGERIEVLNLLRPEDSSSVFLKTDAIVQRFLHDAMARPRYAGYDHQFIIGKGAGHTLRLQGLCSGPSLVLRTVILLYFYPLRVAFLCSVCGCIQPAGAQALSFAPGFRSRLSLRPPKHSRTSTFRGCVSALYSPMLDVDAESNQPRRPTSGRLPAVALPESRRGIQCWRQPGGRIHGEPTVMGELARPDVRGRQSRLRDPW